MQEINNLFDQEITKTVDAYPSIFSKDDVCNLLSVLRTAVLYEATKLQPTASITEMEFQEFSSDVSRKLERALNDGTIDPVDLDSAEFTIGYHNTIEIECVNVDAECITDELANILLDEFQTKFGKFITSETED
jgi:hypothetical protein